MDPSKILTIQDCDEIIKKYLKSDDVATATFNLEPLTDNNYKLKITAYHNQNKKIFNFVAKSEENVGKICKIFDNFKKVLPNFTQNSFTPDFYHINSNLIVFEDLTTQDFENTDGFLNLSHLFEALRALAKFHAAGLVFAETKSKNGGRCKMNEEFDLLLYNMDLRTTEISKFLSNLLDKTALNNVLTQLEEAQLSSKFRKTLCHGNLSSKNLMFKHEKGAPTDCKLINIKSNFYASPVYDVLQLIFFNTNDDLRQHHLHTLLSFYYECLKEETKKYCLDIDGILSFEDYQLSSHHVLPLVKLETALLGKEEAVEELKEILAFPLISKEDCYVIIKNKLGTSNYKLISFEVTALSDVSGYWGEYYKLQTTIFYLSNQKTLNFFIKCKPRSGISRDICQQLSTFSREAFMYNIMVPQMLHHGITIIKECLPPCYFQRHEDFMVFEDMSLLNYRNCDRSKPLDFSYVAMLIRKMAKFHCCSLILEEKISQENKKPYRLYDVYRQYFDETLFFEVENHLGSKMSVTGVKAVAASFDLFPEIRTESNGRNLQKFWPKFRELFFTVTKPTDRFKNVLCHGDLWTSNMMVKIENNQPTDCILLDFQIVRICSPAFDLLSILYLTLHRARRLEHEKELVQMYYEELTQTLNSYGYSVKNLYPYEDLMGCIEYIRPLMTMHAAIESVWCMCTSEEISSFLTDEETCRRVFFEERTDFITAMCKKSNLYRTRLRECLLDIYDYCDAMCTE